MLYVIKNQRMASYLMSCGFRLVKLDKDKKDPNRNVYLFNDIPEMREKMSLFNK